MYTSTEIVQVAGNISIKKTSSILGSLAISLDDQVHMLSHSVNDFINLFRGKVDHCVIYCLRKSLVIFSSKVCACIQSSYFIRLKKFSIGFISGLLGGIDSNFPCFKCNTFLATAEF